jgi:hypothetical protein
MTSDFCMKLLYQWILPVAFIAIGIAIFTGVMLPNLPSGTGLRLMLGLITVMLGIHRFVASRVKLSDRRPYGGDRTRPWEDSK